MNIRDDILTAAARVFGERGYEAATLDEVAHAVGIKKGSLYYHIRSKEDLLFALHQRLADELLYNTYAALESAQSPTERLRAVLRVAMRLIAEHKQEVTVFLHERQLLSSDRWREVVAKRDAYQRIIEEILSEGIEEGVFRPVPVKVATLGLLGMTNWGYQWFRSNGPLSADAIADVFTDMVIEGLRARGGDERPSGAT
jgi:AcrR family transcriptional regulator